MWGYHSNYMNLEVVWNALARSGFSYYFPKLSVLSRTHWSQSKKHICFFNERSIQDTLDAAIRDDDVILARSVPWNFYTLQPIHDSRCCIMDHLAYYGSVQVAEYLLSRKYKWSHEISGEAARKGHLPFLRFCVKHNLPMESAVYTSAKRGHVKCLKYSLKHCNSDSSFEFSFQYAAQEDHIECFKILHNHGCQWDDFSMLEAAKYKGKMCFEYAFDNGCPYTIKTLCLGYIQFKDLKYWNELKKNKPWNSDVCVVASEYGDFDLVKYLHKNGCSWDQRVPQYAVKNGHLEILQYCIQNGCKIKDDTWIEAAKRKDTIFLRYLCEYPGLTRNLFYSEKHKIMNSAAGSGNFEGLSYLYSIWERMFSDTFCAALSGRLDILQYVYERRGEWDPSTMFAIATNGNLPVLKYAYNNGCLWIRSFTRVAFEHQKRDMIEFAINHGCEWAKGTKGSCHKNLDLLKFVHNLGCPWYKEDLLEPCEDGRIDIITYALNHGFPSKWCSTSDCVGYVYKM